MTNMISPTNLETVIGHEEVLAKFQRTIARGRLASTYLFVGPEGIGKRQTAWQLAKRLLCAGTVQPDSLMPCKNCESCRLFELGSHPDLLQVSKPEGKSSLPISLFVGDADHRNQTGLCHDISLKPLVGRRRVAIIDDADSFSIESANCLLKTLEEPPPGAVLFLIGTTLSKQLPTIRSRSQVFRFSPLEDDQLAKVLVSRQGELFDGEPISEQEAMQLASQAGGSVTHALALREPGLVEARESILQSLRAGVDPIRFAVLLEEQTKSAGTEPSLRRARFRELMRIIMEHYRTLAVSPENEYALDALDACLEAEEALGRNANQSTLVQVLATRLGRIEHVRHKSDKAMR